jgi:hypothetical protein
MFLVFTHPSQQFGEQSSYGNTPKNQYVNSTRNTPNFDASCPRLGIKGCFGA